MTTKQKYRIRCSIPGCQTIFGQDKTIKRHRMRKSVINSEKERQKWMEALPFLKNENFVKQRFLMCSLHFKNEDYIYRPLRHFKREKDLKPNVMPSLNLPSSKSNPLFSNDATEEKWKNIKKLISKKKKTGELLNKFGRYSKKLQNELDHLSSAVKKLKKEIIQDEMEDVLSDSDRGENQINILHQLHARIKSIGGDSARQSITKKKIKSHRLDKNKCCKCCKCYKCCKKTEVGNQCEIILGSFANRDFNKFYNENIETFGDSVERNELENNKMVIDITNEDEMPEGIRIREAQMKNFEYKHLVTTEPTCDIPSDDIFFKEISNKLLEISDLALPCCEQCGLTFTDIKSYRGHEGVHAEISLLCYICGVVSSDYMKHIEHEYKCKQYQSICSEMPKSDLKNLSKTKENKIIIRYLCEECCKVFDDKDAYEYHIKEHLNKLDSTTITKQIIDSDIQHKMEYKISENTTLEFLKNPIEDYHCSICGKSYGTEYLLNRHIDLKHLNPIRKSPLLQCKECDMKFRNLTKLQTHVREHVVTQKHCKICNLIHDNNEKYLKHLEYPKHYLLEEKWKHLHNIELFACTLCKTEETQYKNLSQLADHSEFHRISKTRTFINGSLAEHELNAENFKNNI